MTGPATFPKVWRRARHVLRPVVVATGDWPGIGQLQRGVYRLQRARIARALGRLDPDRTVVLRGSARRRPRPGLSDLDLVVLLDAPTAAGERQAVVETLRCVRRVNRLAPLIRDVTFLSRDDVLVLASLDHVFLSVIRRDAEPLVAGRADLERWMPAEAAPADARAVSLRHHVGYWTHKGVGQWLREPRGVGEALAARSFAKAARFARALDEGENGEGLLDPRDASPAGARDVLAALGRLDAVIGQAPRDAGWPRAATAEVDASPSQVPDDPEPPSPPAPLDTRRLLDGLADLDAIFAGASGGAILVAIDPSHARPRDLERVREVARAHRSLRLITERQLARRPLLHRLGLEPLEPIRPTQSLPTPEVAPGEPGWVARWAIVERWWWLRERLDEPWSPRERREHVRAVTELLARAWPHVGLDAAAPRLAATDAPNREALYEVMHAAMRALTRSPAAG